MAGAVRRLRGLPRLWPDRYQLAVGIHNERLDAPDQQAQQQRAVRQGKGQRGRQVILVAAKKVKDTGKIAPVSGHQPVNGDRLRASHSRQPARAFVLPISETVELQGDCGHDSAALPPGHISALRRVADSLYRRTNAAGGADLLVTDPLPSLRPTRQELTCSDPEKGHHRAGRA